MNYFEISACVIAGTVLIKKPEWIWKISHLLGNKNEHPKDLTLSIICILGIVLLVFGLLPLFRHLFNI